MGFKSNVGKTKLTKHSNMLEKKKMRVVKNATGKVNQRF